MTKPLTFTALIQKEGVFTFVSIPGTPASHWGARPRYHVCGTIEGIAVRGCLGVNGQDYFLRLGAAWLRGTNIILGQQVSVSLDLEGPKTTISRSTLWRRSMPTRTPSCFLPVYPPFIVKNTCAGLTVPSAAPDTRPTHRRDDYPAYQRATRALSYRICQHLFAAEMVDVSPVIYLINRKFQDTPQVAERNVQSHLLLSRVNMSSAYWVVAGIVAFVCVYQE
jgi:hypothetical protein